MSQIFKPAPERLRDHERQEDRSMNRHLAFMLGLLSIVTVSAQTAKNSVADRLGWIAGCWCGQGGRATFREIWTVGTPDLMIGMSVTTIPDKPPEFEFLRIENRNGVPTYVAQPGGKPPTPFASSAVA